METLAAAPQSCKISTALLFILLTINSGFAMYQSRANLRSVAFIALSYADLVLLLAWRLACHDRRRRKGHRRLHVAAAKLLEATVVCITVLLALSLGSQLRRLLPPQSSERMVLAMVAVVAVFAACSMFLLYKLGWFISPPSQETALPLVQPLPAEL